MSSTECQELMQWIRERDAASFRSLVERHYSMVYATAYRILGNHADAEDVVQECFLKLFRNPPRKVVSMGSWLHRVATNVALDLRRRAQRRIRRESLYDEAMQTPGSIASPEIDAFVDDAIDNLSEQYRDLVVSHFLEGETLSHMATQRGVSQQTLSYRKRKALEQLRNTLSRRGIQLNVGSIASSLTAAGFKIEIPSDSYAVEKCLADVTSKSPDPFILQPSVVRSSLSFYAKYLAATAATVVLIFALVFVGGRTDSHARNSVETDFRSPETDTVVPDTVVASTAIQQANANSDTETVRIAQAPPAGLAETPEPDPATALLRGLLVMENEPIPDTEFSFHPPLDPDQNQFRTDSRGRFEIVGLPRNDVGIQAQIVFEDGVRQLSRITPFKLEPDTTTDVIFNFSWGETVLEGYIYRQVDGDLEPISCRLDVLYQHLDAESIKGRVTTTRESLWFRSDREGHYLIDELAGGRISLTIYPENAKTYKHRTSFTMGNNQHYRHDFVLGNSEIEFTVDNIPDSTQTLWGFLYAGTVELFPLTPANGARKMIEFEDIQIAATGIRRDENTGNGAFDGLKPGYYTVVAASFPCPATTRDIREMGEEFLYTFGIAKQQVFVGTPNSRTTVHLDSFEFQPRPEE